MKRDARPTAYPWSTVALLLWPLLLLTACLDDDPLGLGNAPDIEDVEFHPSLGIDLDEFTRTETGLHWKLEEEGEGDPAEIGDRVWVTYHGWLPSGVLFDTNEAGDLLDFVLGTAGIIPGFQEGVWGMRIEETRLLLIPPHLAYGSGGNSQGGIPPNSWLVMRVTLEREPDDGPG